MKFKSIIITIFILIISGLPPAVFASTLSLDPASGTFNRSCSFSVNVVVDTEGIQSDGADAYLLYDSTRFTAQRITNGTIFADYPGNTIDNTTGKVSIAGLASATSSFSGKGTLATIDFMVGSNAPTGSAQMTFDFDPNNKAKTTDSNVIETGTIVETLNSVTNGNYVVGTGACTVQPTASPTVGPGVTPTPPPGKFIPTPVPPRGGLDATPSGGDKALPPAGSEKLTFTIAIVGGVLTVLGILGLAIL